LKLYEFQGGVLSGLSQWLLTSAYFVNQAVCFVAGIQDVTIHEAVTLESAFGAFAIEQFARGGGDLLRFFCRNRYIFDVKSGRIF